MVFYTCKLHLHVHIGTTPIWDDPYNGQLRLINGDTTSEVLIIYHNVTVYNYTYVHDLLLFIADMLHYIVPIISATICIT